MTGDELASALYVEQGFLVITGKTPCEIGEIITLCHSYGPSEEPINTPIKVIGPSSLEELRAQWQLALRLFGDSGELKFGELSPGNRYYYRVEAAD